jgi:hypothetical protein
LYEGVVRIIVQAIGQDRRAHHYHRNRAANLLGPRWSLRVSHIWTVKNSAGHVVPSFIGASRLDVERKVVPTYYDAFRLHVSQSYREMFDRELAKVLSHKRWRIIRIRTRAFSTAMILCRRSVIGDIVASDTGCSGLLL